MVEPTIHYDIVKAIINKVNAPPFPVTLKSSPLRNFQIVGPRGEIVAYCDDPAELVDWVTDNKYLEWQDSNNPAN